MHNRFPDHIAEVFFAMCKSVDSPTSLGAYLRFKYGEHLQLAEMCIDPMHYRTASAFDLDYTVVCFLSKYKGLTTGLNLQREALQRFTSSEDICHSTNARLIKARRSGFYPLGVGSILHAAQRKISRVLGSFKPSIVLDGGGWGPGATLDIRRRAAFPDTKMCQLPISCTPLNLPAFVSTVQADLHWSAALLNVNPDDIVGPFSFLRNCFALGSVCEIACVPKNAKTDRVIAKEPTANGFIQKAYGSYIRKRLKRFGVDLDNQTLNQHAAKCAYERGLATLDLKAASDTVALELVYELLPVDWSNALYSCRSPSALLPDGKEIFLRKFSSMGNGFTFELESLIFWALSSAVLDEFTNRKEVFVYGDDIVVPSEVVPQLVTVLNYCGFQVNMDKSFWDGPFYESCGKHYFEGHEVTPIYQKQTSDNSLELCRLGNRIIRRSARSAKGWCLDRHFSSAWHYVYRVGAHHNLPFIPLGTEGDDGLLLPGSLFPEVNYDINYGHSCPVYRSSPRYFPANPRALLALSLREGVVTESPYNDSVDVPPHEGSVAIGRRWVMPTWEFGLTFER